MSYRTGLKPRTVFNLPLSFFILAFDRIEISSIKCEEHDNPIIRSALAAKIVSLRFPHGLKVISVRRFFARLATLVFGATGLPEPRPLA
jgi:hypothetical protein